MTNNKIDDMTIFEGARNDEVLLELAQSLCETHFTRQTRTRWKTLPMILSHYGVPDYEDEHTPGAAVCLIN